MFFDDVAGIGDAKVCTQLAAGSVALRRLGIRYLLP